MFIPWGRATLPLLSPQVNTAARMETTSEPGRVHLSVSAANVLLRSPVDDLVLVSRGPRTIKGKVRPSGAHESLHSVSFEDRVKLTPAPSSPLCRPLSRV